MKLPFFRLTILGSGTSQGVPLIGCSCAVCTSVDPRDKRTRCSIYVEAEDFSLIVDTTPELRLQCVREGITHCEATVFTHPHADHIMGFDDLRRFCEMTNERMPIYANAETLAALRHIYGYAFTEQPVFNTYVRVTAHEVAGAFDLGPLRVTPLPVPHGKITVFGYLFEREGRKLLAYISDCAAVPEAVRAMIAGVEVLVIDGLRDQPHPTHLTAAQAVEVGQAVAARATYLTHLTHHKSHVDRERGLPSGCFVAYDGLKLNL
jgi:phosphoribosyl 1,2-cyclic phosphate phosphodiesterase